MSFSDVYKKTLLNRGGSILNADVMHSKNTTNRSFVNDYTYKKGRLQKPNMEVIDIDTRRVSKDKNTYDKDIYFRPDTMVDVGSYLIYDDGIYLVDGFNKDYINPKGVATECGQELYFPDLSLDVIPCTATNSGYGVKLNNTTEFTIGSMSNIKIKVQSNEITRKIKPNRRFIFNHSEHGIYEIKDIEVYNTGILLFTCDKSLYRPQYDDLENNVADSTHGSEDIKPPIDDQVKTYTIKGCPNDEMIMGKTETFTLEPPTDGVTWVINNELSINPNVAEIVSQDTNSCVVKCNIGDDCFEIQAIKDKQVINSNKKLILTARR